MMGETLLKTKKRKDEEGRELLLILLPVCKVQEKPLEKAREKTNE